MNVAHVALVTPKRCGLYETTHETVVGLRALGVDSRIVDPDPLHNPINWRGNDDRGVPIADIAWANQADVIVSHSGIGDHFKTTGQPIVYVAHGRPKVSYLTEKSGGLPLLSHFYRLNQEPRYEAVVTYWPQHVPYLQVAFPSKRVCHVQSSVDLNLYCPGEDKYDFAGKRGEVNVVISDAWREDIDPYTAINAFALWAKDNRHARLHVYGLPRKDGKWQRGAWVLLQYIEDMGCLGEVSSWSNDLASVYNSTDFVLTPHTIDVRTVREAMACGCPVVRIGESLQFDVPRQTRSEVRAEAESRFNPQRTAEQFKGILESLSWKAF